jgi:NADH-quinone oxidoreductase subunit M
MEILNQHLLSFLIFFPLVWGILSLLYPAAERVGMFKHHALVGSLVLLVVSLKLFASYDPAGEAFQFQEKLGWIESLGITYTVGVDGVSLVLILLTTFLMPIVLLGSFSAVEERSKEFYFYLQLLQFGMIGAFLALDTFLFYVFWEVMLIPMYFLIGIWGGKDRIYAAMKFFVYTMVGSLLMLVAIFYLGYQHQIQFGSFSMSLLDLYKVVIPGGGWLSPQSLLFLAFALAFAIKVPLFPLHTWLPDAHVQAPTAGSVILAGVLLKLGGYGFLRFAFPLFPDAVNLYQPIFLGLGSFAIIYGACVAMVQSDIKKLVAYSSVSHMGYVMIGLFAMNSLGMMGATYQMLNHGISTGGLFLLVGMIYERRHTREIADFGGLSRVMPLFTIALMIMTLSSIALPGTNGFVGEFLILLGTWVKSPLWGSLAALGVVLGAAYMLIMFQRVMFGKIRHQENESLKDLSFREIMVMLPLIVMVVFMGVYPKFLFEKMEPSLNRILQQSIFRETAVASETVSKEMRWVWNR